LKDLEVGRDNIKMDLKLYAKVWTGFDSG